MSSPKETNRENASAPSCSFYHNLSLDMKPAVAAYTISCFSVVKRWVRSAQLSHLIQVFDFARELVTQTCLVLFYLIMVYLVRAM
jgi:hypothetical protein